MSVSCLCIPMQCLCRFYAAKACQALLLCLMYAVLPVCLMSECKTVEVLSLMNTMAEVQISATAVVAGFNASLRSKRNQPGDHVNITVITPTLEEVHNVTYIEQFLSNSNESILRVVLGPLGSVPIKMLLPLLETYDVVAFGPISAGIAGRQRNQHLYFLTASPYADLMALIRYSLGYLRVQRLAFMYLRGFSFGEEEYALTVKALEHVGRKLSGVFVMDSSLEMPAPEHVFDKAWSQFAATRPQAVLLFGQACSDTLNFLERLLSDERTTNTYVLAPSSIGFVVHLSFRVKLNQKGLFFQSGQLIFTGWGPLARDTDYIAIANFQNDTEEYLRVVGSQYGYDDDYYFLKHDSEGELMVYGWTVGEVLKQALSTNIWLENQSTFRESLYNQRRYVVNDLVFGDFGWGCDNEAARSGAVCHCNDGGKTVYLKRVLGDGRIEFLEEGSVTLDIGACGSSVRKIQAPLNGLFFNMVDDEIASIASKIISIIASVFNGDGRLGQHDRLFLQHIDTTSQDILQRMSEEQKERIVTAVFGIVTDALLDTPNVTFIDPIPRVPRLADKRRNVIHLSPTAEQQLFVLTDYLSNTHSPGLHAVIRSREGVAFADVLSKTLWTYSVPSLSSVLLREDEQLDGWLPAYGDTLLIGVTLEDVSLLESHLNKYHDTRILILFSELALLYDEFEAAFRNSTGARRLLFATNLPHWNDLDTVSEHALMFGESADNLWIPRTPLTMLGFTTARLMQEVLTHTQTMNSYILAQYFYTNVAIGVDDMHYGPFDDSNCDPLIKMDEQGCAVNYGATGISVWSMARALDPTVPEDHQPVTRALVYREPLYLGMPLHTFVGVFFAFILIMAFVGVLIYVHFFRRDGRDNRNAPKAPSVPVTLVFTDIESSTAQWAANPQLMPDAIAAHHRLIRSLIARHRCYEVKTIGDSFMIACKSALAAVELVRDLQRQFLEHDWGTAALDESYRAFEEKRAAEDAEYVPPTARLEPEVYRRLWNGLRVRAGVHTGLCDIRHDEVTKGYDYYGGTSNMAARTESVAHGGQVLLTRAAYMALRTDERKQLDVTPLGAVPLRGVPVPVEMFQLNAVPGRTFGALRLDVEVNDVDDANCTSSSLSGDTRPVNELSYTGSMIAASLFSLLKTFPATEKRKVLLLCCERWCVSSPKTKESTWTDAMYQETINRIATAVVKVAQFKVHFDQYDLATCVSDTNSLRSTRSVENVFLPSLAEHERFDNKQLAALQENECSFGSFRQTFSLSAENARTPEVVASPHIPS